MLPDPQPGAERPTVPAPNFLLWLGVHLVLALGIALLNVAVPDKGPGWAIAMGPLGLGLAQAAVLGRRLPVWARILWPLATALGFALSTVFVWFMHAALGLCLGICQAGLLAAGRFRGWLLWPLVSGASWLSVLSASAFVAGAIEAMTGNRGAHNRFVVVLPLLGHALGTGAALRWMGRPRGGQGLVSR